MADYDNILLDVDGAVATITLNRPEKLNAMNQGLLTDLFDALRELRGGDAVRVIRLKAAGRAFCAGYDLTPEKGALSWQPNERTGDRAAELGESRIALDREGLRDTVERWLWMARARAPDGSSAWRQNGFRSNRPPFSIWRTWSSPATTRTISPPC